jgi:hypothetical protein
VIKIDNPTQSVPAQILLATASPRSRSRILTATCSQPPQACHDSYATPALLARTLNNPLSNNVHGRDQTWVVRHFESEYRSPVDQAEVHGAQYALPLSRAERRRDNPRSCSQP